MAPDEETQREIERYRVVTGEQRLRIALDMTTRAMETERDGIRHEFRDADEAEIDRLFRMRMTAANERQNEQERLTAFAAIRHAASISAPSSER